MKAAAVLIFNNARLGFGAVFPVSDDIRAMIQPMKVRNRKREIENEDRSAGQVAADHSDD